jgi:hypothetical protein
VFDAPTIVKEGMMTSTRLTGVLVVSALLLATTAAFAQGPAPLEQGYVHLNVGVQASSEDLAQNGAVPLYDEQATFTALSEVEGGPFLDIGGGWRVWSQMYVGLSYTRLGDDGAAAITGRVPHPLFFDRFRDVGGTAPNLSHTEQAVHLQAVWRQPVTTAFDVAVSLGPTFFSVKQDLVSGLALAEGPGDNVSISGVPITEVSESTVGFNLGVDGTYMFTRRLGGGAFIRYTGGSVDLEAPGATVSLDVGGFQVGGGIRFRF